MDFNFNNLNLFFPFKTFSFIDIIQIVILFFIFYGIMKSLKRTRAWVIVKGIIVIFILYFLFKICAMTTIAYLFERFSSLAMISIVIMFQPELRKLLEKIGKKDIVKSFIPKKNKNEDCWFTEKTIIETVQAANEMSKVKTGALIVFERAIPLEDWIKTGIDVNANPTWQLFINIFEHNTPLHDGAVIIVNDTIKSATCYLPLTDNLNIDKSMGTRHRAGIGITECTDAIVIIVSEETGAISYVENGIIQHNISAGKLSELLLIAHNKINKEKEHKKNYTPIFKNKSNILKIVSIVLSVIAWFTIVNANDDVISKTYTNIPVTISNENIIEDTGYAYNISEGDTIDVTIFTRRSITEELKKEDIIASVDFKDLSITNSVPINVEFPKDYKDYIEIKNMSTNTMNLSLESTKSIEIPIEVKFSGKEKDGFKAYIPNTETYTTVVSGPSSIIEVLEKGVAMVDVSNKDTDFTKNVSFVLYDRNGTKIDNTKLSMANDTIDVFVNFYHIKYVKVNVLPPNDTENAKYELEQWTAIPSEVPIIGEQEKLDTISQIDIQTGLDETFTTDWSYKLPQDIYPAIDDTSITITSMVKNYEYTTYSVPTSYINVKNLDSGYELKYKNPILTFSAYVDSTIKDNIDPKKLEPTIDAKNIKNNEVTISFRETDGIQIENDITISVERKKISK